MASRFISMREVRNRTTFSKTHIYRLIRAGTFPRQVSLGGPHRVAFLESEIDEWMDARVRAREYLNP